MSIDVPAWTLGLCVLVAGCGGTWDGSIHARLGYSAAGGLRVIEVPDGPARRAGLEVGDRIVAIDGHGVRELVHHRVADGIVVVDGDDAEPSREEAVARIDEKLRGQVGTRVTLRVMRGETEHEVTVERAPFERRAP